MTTACRRSSRLPRHPRRRVVSDVKQAREGVIPTAVDRPGPTGAFTAVGLVLGEIEPHHDRPAALGIVEFFVDGAPGDGDFAAPGGAVDGAFEANAGAFERRPGISAGSRIAFAFDPDAAVGLTNDMQYRAGDAVAINRLDE